MRTFPGTKNRNEGTFAKTALLRTRPLVSSRSKFDKFRSCRVFVLWNFFRPWREPLQQTPYCRFQESGRSALGWPALLTRTYELLSFIFAWRQDLRCASEHHEMALGHFPVALSLSLNFYITFMSDPILREAKPGVSKPGGFPLFRERSRLCRGPFRDCS